MNDHPVRQQRTWLLSPLVMATEEFSQRDRDVANNVIVCVKTEFFPTTSVKYEVLFTRGNPFFTIQVYEIEAVITWKWLKTLVDSHNECIYNVNIEQSPSEKERKCSLRIHLFFRSQIPRSAPLFVLHKYRQVKLLTPALLKSHDLSQFVNIVDLLNKLSYTVYNSSKLLPVVHTELNRAWKILNSVASDKSTISEKIQIETCVITFTGLEDVSFSMLEYIVNRIVHKSAKRIVDLCIVPLNDVRLQLNISLIPLGVTGVEVVQSCHLFRLSNQEKRLENKDDDGGSNEKQSSSSLSSQVPNKSKKRNWFGWLNPFRQSHDESSEDGTITYGQEKKRKKLE